MDSAIHLSYNWDCDELGFEQWIFCYAVTFDFKANSDCTVIASKQMTDKTQAYTGSQVNAKLYRINGFFPTLNLRLHKSINGYVYRT